MPLRFSKPMMSSSTLRNFSTSALRRRLQQDYTEVGELHDLAVTSNWHDDSVLSDGCPPTGCVAANVRDGSTEPKSRWSCRAGEVDADDGDCTLTFDLGTTEFVTTINVAFHEGDQQSCGFVLYGDRDDTDSVGTEGAWIFTSKRMLGLQTFPVWSGFPFQVFRLTHFISDVGSEWIGITEVEIFVTDNGQAATAPPTKSPTPAPIQITSSPVTPDAGNEPTAPQPTPIPTYAALATPAPILPIMWVPKTGYSSSGSSPSSSRDDGVIKASAVPDNVSAAIGVTVTTAFLAVLGIAIVVFGSVSAVRRKKRMAASTQEAASGFSSPLTLMPLSRAGVESFFGVAWQPTPSRVRNNDGLTPSSSASRSAGRSRQRQRDAVDMSEERLDSQYRRTWVVPQQPNHMRSGSRSKSMPAGRLLGNPSP